MQKVDNAFSNDFAHDLVELSIFSTSFKHDCPAARTESLFSLVSTKTITQICVWAATKILLHVNVLLLSSAIDHCNRFTIR